VALHIGVAGRQYIDMLMSMDRSELQSAQAVDGVPRKLQGALSCTNAVMVKLSLCLTKYHAMKTWFGLTGNTSKIKHVKFCEATDR